MSVFVGFDTVFAAYYFSMDLSLFCDMYIMAEFLRLKAVLNNMPRYRIGIHNGFEVIRTYRGYGDQFKFQEYRLAGRNSNAIKQQYETYKECLKVLDLYQQEIRRRNIPIPNDYKFYRDPSPFNVAAWQNYLACSNPHEIGTEYYDAYGNNVRSRGEMSVANALKSLGLEAKYEPELTLKSGRKRSPDYSFPVRIIDRCFFIEFYGRCDNESYLDYNHGKIDEYIRNGILPNRDLILICGTENWIPTQESIMRMIANFINNAVLSTYNRNS